MDKFVQVEYSEKLIAVLEAAGIDFKVYDVKEFTGVQHDKTVAFVNHCQVRVKQMLLVEEGKEVTLKDVHSGDAGYLVVKK